MLGYSVPNSGMEDVIKDEDTDQRYLATIKYEKSNIVTVKVGLIKKIRMRDNTVRYIAS